MDKFKISGTKQLNGTVRVGGSKNAALPIMAATLIQKGEYVLKNIPVLRDTKTMLELLKSFGLEVSLIGKNSFKIINKGITNHVAEYDLVKVMRASFITAGPMLANIAKAKISLPGGCNLGERPVNYHLDGLEQMGVRVTLEHGYLDMEVDDLIGADILLPFPSVGATQNLMAAAVKAKGNSVIRNAAKEPEVIDMANFLVKMGAKIKGIGSSELFIEGVEELTGVEYEVIPDRIEAATFVIASLVTEGNLEVTHCKTDDFKNLIVTLEKMGAQFDIKENSIKNLNSHKDMHVVNIKTMPHPGFPTDVQPHMMVLLSMLKGNSIIEETLFKNRFMQVPELNRMGAKIEVDGLFSNVSGDVSFSGATVMASDIRGGASLVLAALVAEGETIINRVYHIDRGYEELDQKLKKLGVQIERIT